MYLWHAVTVNSFICLQVKVVKYPNRKSGVVNHISIVDSEI